MANQYCKITSWIQHNKKHGDPDYAQAILDLCLDINLKPSNYQGLTFLYQTDSKIRKKFSKDVFCVNAHDLCKEFKRYILPDTFLSCEDFDTKEVGNIMGHKYEVKSCTNNTVIFKNGMKIQPIENNSYVPLSDNLKNIIKIYYVVEGEPPSDENGLYTVAHRKKQKKTARGGNGKLIRGGTKDEFFHVYESSRLSDHIKDIPHQNIYYNGNHAFHAILHILKSKLEEHSDGEIHKHIKNLILAQWLVNSIPEGIIAYIYMCLYILYHAPESEVFKEIVNEIIMKILEILTSSGKTVSTEISYYITLTELSSELGFNKSAVSLASDNGITGFIQKLSASKDTDIIDQFYQRITQYPAIWQGTFIPSFEGELCKDIPKYGAYLGLWVLSLFSPLQVEIEHIPKMELLDKIFIKLIDSGESGSSLNILNIHLFTKETLGNLIRGHTEDNTTATHGGYHNSVGLATGQINFSQNAGGRYPDKNGENDDNNNLFD